MYKRLLLSILLFGGLLANAQSIEVSGSQSGVWNADTVYVTGNVKVQDSLYIHEGTTVVFKGFFNVLVKEGASLYAMGTEADSILFTVVDTTGFHIFNSGRGGWNGIRLEKAGRCRFDYCRFQYGKAALDEDQDGGALRIFDSDNVEINHSTLYCNFSREHGGALNAVDSKVVLDACNVVNNLTFSRVDTIYFMYGGGMRFLKCEIDITKTDFRYNNGESAIGGALSIDSCMANIDRCRFEYNYGINGAGLYMIRCYDNPCSITNSLFANNTSGHFGGGLAISDSSPLVSNLTVVNNLSIGVNCGGIFFYQYSSPVVQNCIIYGNENSAPLEEPVQMWSWTFEENAPQFYNCLVQYGLENISNNEFISVYEDCLDGDPCFVNPENGDFHLNGNSPCINAGCAFGEEGFDLDGRWRVCGDRIDIGAYEYSGLGVLESAHDEKSIRIIGNPITTSSYVEIDLGQDGFVTIDIYSLEGKVMGHRDFGKYLAGNARLEVGDMFQDLAKGSYLLVVRNAGRSYTTKVLVL